MSKQKVTLWIKEGEYTRFWNRFFTRRNDSKIKYKESKVMEWMKNISNSDSLIFDIEVKDSCLIVYIKLWNEVIRKVKFINYYIFKDKNSIGEEIGDIKVQSDSMMLGELRQDILNGDGTLDEIADVKCITFYNAWNDKIILEVLTDKMVCE